MKKLEQKIINFINQHNLIKKNDKLLIAFSGGPDSTFALFFLNKFKKKYKIEIAAIHFNHQLRGKESDDDEKFCFEFCQSLNIPFFSFKLNVKEYAKENKLSIEEAARILRYNVLDNFSKKNNFNKIVTAHNLSDNTETVLINLFSGTGYSGFSGVPIKRENIIRPFLCISKEEILNYLNNNNINYRIDSSNLQIDFKRNFIRNKILPLIRERINPKVDEAIFRSSKILEVLASIIDNYINELIIKHTRISKDSIFIKSSAKKIENEIFGELLKKLLKDNFNYHIEYNDIYRIKSLYEKQKGKKIFLTKKISVVREKNGIEIFYNKEEDRSITIIKVGESAVLNGKTLKIEEVNRNKIKFGKSRNVEYISADNLSDKFILRKWQPGDKFIPLGMKKPKKISDFLTDAKIKSSEKKDKFVLENNKFIVWLVGLRIDDRFKITSQTKRILKLWIK